MWVDIFVLFVGFDRVSSFLFARFAHTVAISDLRLTNPTHPPSAKSLTPLIYPSECRNRGTSYRGRLMVNVKYRVNGGEWVGSVREAGGVPVMVKVRVKSRTNL